MAGGNVRVEEGAFFENSAEERKGFKNVGLVHAGDVTLAPFCGAPPGKTAILNPLVVIILSSTPAGVSILWNGGLP
jgi:hypothetical protein